MRPCPSCKGCSWCRGGAGIDEIIEGRCDGFRRRCRLNAGTGRPQLGNDGVTVSHEEYLSLPRGLDVFREVRFQLFDAYRSHGNKVVTGSHSVNSSG